MRFDLLFDGHTKNVEVGVGKGVTVRLDGKVFQGEVTHDDEGTNVRFDDQTIRVRFDGSHVWINGERHRLEVRNVRRVQSSLFYSKDRRSQGSARGTAGIANTAGMSSPEEEIIHSPLPGSVISIKVKVGDHVKDGSTILVLEAMKMQNEILSHRDGIVREIRVAEGELVESGNILVVIGN